MFPVSFFSFRFAAGLAALLLALPALAERTDRDQPMNIEADAMRYEDQQQLSTFTGNVVVTKGSIVLRGAKLQVKQDTNGNQQGVMTATPGQRVFFRQKRDGVNEFIEGEAQTMEYDGKSDTVRLTGRAEMRRLAGTQLQDQVRGSVIVYNNRTDVYTVDGGERSSTPSAARGGRVSATLAPRQSNTAAPTPAASTSLRPTTRLPAQSGQPAQGGSK